MSGDAAGAHVSPTPAPALRSRVRELLTRELSRDDFADLAIYGFVLLPAVFLGFYANIQIIQVITATSGVIHAQLIAMLIEADGVLGAFLAAVFVIRYELTKMWREETQKKVEEAVAERRHQESRVR